MFVLPSRDVIVNSSIILQGSGSDVPCTVVVAKIAGISSCGGIWSFFAASGSIIVMLAWSSMMARPSREWFEFGRVNITGQVRLYDCLRRSSERNDRPWTSLWRPGHGCQYGACDVDGMVNPHPRVL